MQTRLLLQLLRHAATCSGAVSNAALGVAAQQRAGRALHAPSAPRVAAAHVPLSVQRAFEGAPFAAAVIPGAGRGLVAARAIRQGQQLLREAPLVCAPPVARRGRVCYACLAPISGGGARGSDAPSSSGGGGSSVTASAAQDGSSGRGGGTGGEGPRTVQLPGGRGAVAFCSDACLAAATGSFFALEREVHAGLRQLDDYCEAHGEKFPLLAARLALGQLQQAAAAGGGGGGGGGQEQASGSSCGSDTTDSSASSGGGGTSSSAASSKDGSLGDLSFLCFANVGWPPPATWQESYQLLRRAVDSAVAAGALGAGEGGGSRGGAAAGGGLSGGDGEEAAGSAVAAAAAQLDLRWYCDVLARLHLNVFRVETVAMPDFMDLASLASASLGAGSSGSALYLTASLFNHACEPNTHVTWPRNDAVAAFTAARDIAPGEQLTITYIDSNQPVVARRGALREAYGFECGCALCAEEAAGAG